MKLTRINSKIDQNPFTPASCCLALKGRRNRPEQGEQGTTLVEIAIAGAILAVGLAGLYALLGTTVNEVKRGHTASGAQENTVARLDQMRNLTWASITNAATVATVLGTSTSSDSSSTISREVIAVSPAAVPQTSPLPSPTPLPTATPGPGFSVIKTGGSVTISPSPYPSLVAEKLVNVTVTTEWTHGWRQSSTPVIESLQSMGKHSSETCPFGDAFPHSMKLNESVLSSRRAGGMTLVELMIALGIVGFVLLVCYSSSIGLQRGFGYSSAWTEARVSQERVLDSLALDLRNATKIDFTLALPVIVTLTVPSRYSSYYRNTGDPSVTFNAAAGDPTHAASPIPAPTPNPFWEDSI